MIDEVIRDIARTLARAWFVYRHISTWTFFVGGHEVEITARIVTRPGRGANEVVTGVVNYEVMSGLE